MRMGVKPRTRCMLTLYCKVRGKASPIIGWNRYRALCLLRASWSDPHRFDIDELADAVDAELPAVARRLHASKRQPRVGFDHAVDEHRACVEVVDEALALGCIVGPCAC